MGILPGNCPIGGKIIPYSYPDGIHNRFVLMEQVLPVSPVASVALQRKIPANSRLIWAGMSLIGAATLATAVNIGFGPAALPTLLLMTGSGGFAHAVTAGTKFGPVFNRSPGMIFQLNASSAAIGNASTAEATFVASLAATGQAPPSIPANTLKVGDVIRIRGGGRVVVAATGTVTINVKIGSDIYLGMTSGSTPVTGDLFNFDTDIQITAIGATGSARATGRGYIGTTGVVAGANDIPFGAFLGATALDTTAAVAPIVTGTFSGSGTQNLVLDQFTVEIIRNSQDLILPADTALLVNPVTKAGLLAGTIGSTSIAGGINCYCCFETLEALPDVS